ncbi:hypothetical protein VPHD239_0118 [Vibrio phage D239]
MTSSFWAWVLASAKAFASSVVSNGLCSILDSFVLCY